MIIPTNLLVIVTIQAFVFLCLLLTVKLFGISGPIQWRVSFGVGIGFGVLMDSILGGDGIFAYLPSGPASAHLYPSELSFVLLVFNAIASYGIAALSIATIAPSLFENRYFIGKGSLWLGSLIVCGLFLVVLVPSHSLALMFAWGAVIIGFSELFLYLGKKTGPVLALFNEHNYRPFLKLFIFSSLVGSIYESANMAFPFWVWLPESSVNPNALTALVIFAGYFVLFHPMAALYTLLIDAQPAE